MIIKTYRKPTCSYRGCYECRIIICLRKTVGEQQSKRWEQSLKWIERERYSWETLSHLTNCYIVRQICKILPWTAQFHTKSVLGFKLGPQMTLRRPNWSVRGLKQHWLSTIIKVISALIFGWKSILT